MAEQQAAFLIFRIRVEFSGNITFSNNTGGAMLVYQARIDMWDLLSFHGNQAEMGGAVILEDQSWV